MINYDEAGKILSEMVQISRTFRIAGQRSGEQSFSGTRFGFLQHLRSCDARLGELAHRLLISAPVASRAVDSLEAEGMVGRRPDPLDARASLISITDKGRRKLAESETSAVKRFAESLDGWSEEESQNAIKLLKTLNIHLSALTLPQESAEASPIPAGAKEANESETTG